MLTWEYPVVGTVPARLERVLAQTILCSVCYGTGSDPKTSPRVRCRACGGSGLTPAPDGLAHIADNPKHWLNRAEEMRSLAENMRDQGAKAILLHMARDHEEIAARIEKRLNPAGPQNGKHLKPILLNKSRGERVA